MPQVTLPNALVDGVDIAYGSNVYANDSAIVSVVNGQLANDNISASAAIDCKKLSTVAGERVPTNAIEDMAITSGKLKSDADDNNDAVRPVTADHIRNGVVERKKLSSVAGKRITFNYLEAATVTSTTVTVSTPSSMNIPVATNVGAITFTPEAYPVVSGANWAFSIRGIYAASASGITSFYQFSSAALNPALYGLSAMPTATTKILHVYLSNLNMSATNMTFLLNVTYINIS